MQQMEVTQERQRDREAQMERAGSTCRCCCAHRRIRRATCSPLNDQADKSAADTIERQSATIADLLDLCPPICEVRQESSTELLAAANAKSREKQAALDGAKSARREAQDALEAAESELEEAKATRRMPGTRCNKLPIRRHCRQAHHSKCLVTLRAMVTSLKKSAHPGRQAQRNPCNVQRCLQARGGPFAYEERSACHAEARSQKQKASFYRNAALGQDQIYGAVARYDDAEHVAQEAKAKATQAAENLVNKEAEMAGGIAYPKRY